MTTTKRYIRRSLSFASLFMMMFSLIVLSPAQTFATTPAAWSLHPSADETKTWRDVVWSPELKLFVAISASSVMTSPDGINWTFRTTPTGSWVSIAWSPEAAVAHGRRALHPAAW